MQQSFLDVSDGCNGSHSVLLMQLSHAPAASCCGERFLRWQLSRNYGTTSTSRCSTIVLYRCQLFAASEGEWATQGSNSGDPLPPETTC